MQNNQFLNCNSAPNNFPVSDEDYKNFLAMELHDGVCQRLLHIKLTAEKLNSLLPEACKSLDTMKELLNAADGAYNELRNLSHKLSSEFLSDFGLPAALQTLTEDTSNTLGIKGSFQLIGQLINFNRTIEVQIYRISQELLSNILKHSQAKNFSVCLIVSSDTVCLQIEDDGIGFDFSPKSLQHGSGLRNVVNRIKCLRGSLEVCSSPGNGVEIIINFRTAEIS